MSAEMSRDSAGAVFLSQAVMKGPYSKPNLTCFGDIRTITKGGAGASNEADPNCVPPGSSQNTNKRNCP